MYDIIFVSGKPHVKFGTPKYQTVATPLAWMSYVTAAADQNT